MIRKRLEIDEIQEECKKVISHYAKLKNEQKKLRVEEARLDIEKLLKEGGVEYGVIV